MKHKYGSSSDTCLYEDISHWYRTPNPPFHVESGACIATRARGLGLASPLYRSIKRHMLPVPVAFKSLKESALPTPMTQSLVTFLRPQLFARALAFSYNTTLVLVGM